MFIFQKGTSESPKVVKQLKTDQLEISKSTCCAFDTESTIKESEIKNPLIFQDFLFPPEKKEVNSLTHHNPWPREIVIEKHRRWQQPTQVEILRERSLNIPPPKQTVEKRNEEPERFQSKIILKVKINQPSSFTN